MDLPPSPEPNCQKCRDDHFIPVQAEDGIRMKVCDCLRDEIRKEKIDRIVPKMWRGWSIDNLEPVPGFVEFFPHFTKKVQTELIAELRANPFEGHSFYGPSGIGKSVYLYCLLQKAILSGKSVFFSKMYNLIKSIRENEFGKLPEERWDEIVDEGDLKKRTPESPLYIFIDEFDKVTDSEDVYLKIFNLIDFIYENNDLAKLYICSNLPLGEFVSNYGDALTRRINAISIAHNLGGKK
jgi:hypothetical protein